MALQLPLLDLRDVSSARRRTPSRPGVPAKVAVRVAARAPQEPTPPRSEGDSPYWHLDEHTREVGLRGVEEARRALAAAVARTGHAAAA